MAGPTPDTTGTSFSRRFCPSGRRSGSTRDVGGRCRPAAGSRAMRRRPPCGTACLPPATVLVLAVGVIGGGLLLDGIAACEPAVAVGPIRRRGRVDRARAPRPVAVPDRRGHVSVTWGEAALIVGLYLAPAGWLPAATFARRGIAWTLLSLFTERRTRWRWCESPPGSPSRWRPAPR